MKHSHYHKNVAHLQTIDIYRILMLYNVTDPCIGHAVKKLLVAGGRGAGKDIAKDVDEAIDTLLRRREMIAENVVTPAPATPPSKSQFVLPLYDGNYQIFFMDGSSSKAVFNGGFWYFLSGTPVNLEVSHWTPL